MSRLARWVSWSIAVPAAIAVAVYATVRGRGSMVHFVAVFLPAVAGLVLLVPTSIGTLVRVFRHRRAGTRSIRAEWVSQIAAQLSLVSAALAVSFQFAQPLVTSDIEDARQFCEAAIPRLEAYRARNGEYPDTLWPLFSRDEWPRLFADGPSGYSATEDRYKFELNSDSDLWFEGIVYTSEWRVWTERSDGSWESDFTEAREFCEALIPRIEAHRHATGQWPALLSSVVEPGEHVPHLFLTDDAHYGSLDDEFWFEIVDPYQFGPHGWSFDSNSRTWDEWS